MGFLIIKFIISKFKGKCKYILGIKSESLEYFILVLVIGMRERVLFF